MSDLKASELHFYKRYGDDSGIERGVRYIAKSQEIEIESDSQSISIPVADLNWLRDALTEVYYALPKEAKE